MLKRKSTHLILLLNTLLCFNLGAQTFTPPAEGNAVVYIIRTSSFGSAQTFRFFHNETFVGIFKGKGYMRYELPAGKQILWASSENKRFLDCDLKAGGIYLVSSKHKPGIVKNRSVLTPVTVDQPNLESFKDVVANNKEITTSEEKIAEMNKKLTDSGFIQDALTQFEEEQRVERHTMDITPDMAIPLEILQ